MFTECSRTAVFGTYSKLNAAFVDSTLQVYFVNLVGDPLQKEDTECWITDGKEDDNAKLLMKVINPKTPSPI